MFKTKVIILILSCYITSYNALPYKSGFKKADPIEIAKMMESGSNLMLAHINDTDFFEGDMKKGPIVNTRSLGDAGVSFKKWPGGVVPFRIQEKDFTECQLQEIYDGMTMLNQKTDGCISFKDFSGEENALKIVGDEQGCFAYVGAISAPGFGQNQIVSLQKDGCVKKGIVVHELLHSVGFHHEQNRPDRDQYITVNYGNMQEGQEPQFDINKQTDYLGTSYDLDSIMQYENTAFSKDGTSVVIEVKKNKEQTRTLGGVLKNAGNKRDDEIMTVNDISAVKKLYGCKGRKPLKPINQPPSANCKPVTTNIQNDAHLSCNIFVDGQYRFSVNKGEEQEVSGRASSQLTLNCYIPDSERTINMINGNILTSGSTSGDNIIDNNENGNGNGSTGTKIINDGKDYCNIYVDGKYQFPLNKGESNEALGSIVKLDCWTYTPFFKNNQKTMSLPIGELRTSTIQF